MSDDRVNLDDLGDTSSDRIYLESRLHGAADTIRTLDAPLRQRLEVAYIEDLSDLEASHFPDEEGRAEFEGIVAALTKYGEAIPEAGDLPSTLWTMSDEKADELAKRIIRLAVRYGQA